MPHQTRYFCSSIPPALIQAAQSRPIYHQGINRFTGRANRCLGIPFCPYGKTLLDDLIRARDTEEETWLFASGCDATRQVYVLCRTMVPSQDTLLLEKYQSTRKQLLIKTASFLAQRKTLFHLLRPYEWWLKRSNPEPDLARFSYQTTITFLRQAYSREKPVFWCSLFFPAEFIHAAGGIPFYPEIAAGLTAALGFPLLPLEQAAAAWFSQDPCSYHRIGVGMSLLRLFPQPDYLVATSHICSGTVGFFETLTRIWQVPARIIHVPLHSDEDITDYLVSQLTALRNEIASRTSRPFSHEEAWISSNRARDLIRKVQKERSSSASTLLPPGKNLDYLPYYYQFIGTEASVAFFQKFLASIRNHPNQTNLSHRLYWLHLKPFYRNSLARLLTDYGLGVAGEEFTRVNWPAFSIGKPMESLAAKILSAGKTWPGPCAALLPGGSSPWPNESGSFFLWWSPGEWPSMQG